MGTGIDTLEISRSEAKGGGRPDFSRRAGFKFTLVRFEGARIPVREFGAFLGATLGGAVMNGVTEGVPAKIVPVRTGVAKVKVPGLVNVVGRGDLVPGFDTEIEEAVVFLNDGFSVGGGPIVLPGEAF